MSLFNYRFNGYSLWKSLSFFWFLVKPVWFLFLFLFSPWSLCFLVQYSWMSSAECWSLILFKKNAWNIYNLCLLSYLNEKRNITRLISTRMLQVTQYIKTALGVLNHFYFLYDFINKCNCIYTYLGYRPCLLKLRPNL